METIDPAKAARVWQRVQSTPAETAPVQGLTELIAEAQRAALAYQQLSRRLGGKAAVTLRRMQEQALSHSACLKGICTLVDGKRPVVRVTPPVQESPVPALRKCYGNAMRCLAHYEQRTTDREFGQVFQRLAQQQKEHCQQLLAVLGELK